MFSVDRLVLVILTDPKRASIKKATNLAHHTFLERFILCSFCTLTTGHVKNVKESSAVCCTVLLMDVWYNFVKGNGYKNAYILKYSVLFSIAWWRLCYRLNPLQTALFCSCWLKYKTNSVLLSHQSTLLLAFVTKCSSDKGMADLIVGGVRGPSPSVRN